MEYTEYSVFQISKNYESQNIPPFEGGPYFAQLDRFVRLSENVLGCFDNINLLFLVGSKY